MTRAAFILVWLVLPGTALADEQALPLSASCSALLRADGDGRSLVITDARRARVAVTNLPADVRLRRIGDLLYLDGSDADPLHFRDLCTYPMN